jgi:hypothetical protein
MRASLLLLAGLSAAIISVAPAGAQDVDVKKLLAQPRTAAAWKALSYNECRTVVLELGWTQLDSWYACSATPRK